MCGCQAEVRQCAAACGSVRQCSSAAVRVWNCTALWQCEAVRARVSCGSARGSVRRCVAVRGAVCGSMGKYTCT
jgi:hypothetical protein